jgi:ATP-binding cassette subfamily B protein
MKNFLKLYIYFRKFVLKYKKYYLLSILLSFGLVTSYNISIFQIKNLIDSLNNNGDLLQSLIILIILTSIPLVLEPLTFYFKRYVYARSVGDLDNAVYRKVMSLDYPFHVNKQTGVLVSKMQNLDDIIDLIVWQIDWFLLYNISNFLIPIALISYLSLPIGLATLATLLLTIPLEIFAIRYNVKLNREAKLVQHEKNSITVDTVSNYETVRLFGNNKNETNAITNIIGKFIQKVEKYENSYSFIDFSARLSGLLILIVGSYLSYTQYTQGLIQLSELVVIVVYLLSLTNGTISLVFSFKAIFSILPRMEDTHDLLNIANTILEPENPQQPKEVRGEVEFKNVKFKYTDQEDSYGLNDISFNIKPYKNVAFVGASGSGKTTLVRLLLRYYLVDSGSIKIDGYDVNDLGTENINKIVGVVHQEPALFNRSLLYNIGYGLGLSESELSKKKDLIIEAAKKARIHDFIESLPEKYDTVVGERGIKLSGGQRQRIAIARVLVKHSKIIIFDEATSMIDSVSEREIKIAFKEFAKDSTTLVIAHRLSTIKDADMIYVLDKGCIVESGTHEELIALNGQYYDLWDLQDKGYSK